MLYVLIPPLIIHVGERFLMTVFKEEPQRPFGFAQYHVKRMRGSLETT